MKHFLMFGICVCALGFMSTASAEVQIEESDILAQRGNGVVSQSMFAARAEKIPENVRLGTLRDRKRVQDILNSLLLRAQLAADAREAEFDKKQIIIDRMIFAAESELASAWLDHYVASQPPADYEALAYEYYQLNHEGLLSTPSIDVSHILVSTEERTPEEALSTAESIKAELVENPESFDELVMIHSEDPSKNSNRGHFFKVETGDMVKAFEEVAFALNEGEISAPVETPFGYHIIRLDKHHPAKQVTFDEIKANLIKNEQTKHEERIKRNYLSGLTALDVEMTEEALTEMVRRIFGEEFVQPQDEQAESE